MLVCVSLGGPLVLQHGELQRNGLHKQKWMDVDFGEALKSVCL